MILHYIRDTHQRELVAPGSLLPQRVQLRIQQVVLHWKLHSDHIGPTIIALENPKNSHLEGLPSIEPFAVSKSNCNETITYHKNDPSTKAA